MGNVYVFLIDFRKDINVYIIESLKKKGRILWKNYYVHQ